MAKQLGHGVPLGAFRNLGGWVQRHSLGTSSLSILDLKTFYPRGFPAVESSANEPQSSSSVDDTVARKIDTSTPTLDTQTPDDKGISAPALDTKISSDKRTSTPVPDTQISSDKRIPDPALDAQVSSDKRTSAPVPRKQADPFRASLQRYFKPETGVATADVSLSHKGVANLSALTNQVKPDLAAPSTPDLQSASTEKTASDLASAPATNISSIEPSRSKNIAQSKTSADGALQRSTTEETQTNEPDGSQSSVADITNSIQSLQLSSSTPQANAIHSELQRTIGISPPAVEPNTSISAQQPGLTSTDINQSIQSLREPSASIQRATRQHNQRLEQPPDLRTQPEVESKAPPTTPPQLDPQTAQQPKTVAPYVQRLNESTETPLSSLWSNQNPGTASIHNPGQLLQRQPDSTTAAMPAQGPVQQATEQNATQPPNSGTAAIPTHRAEPSSGSVQRATEQNTTQLPSSFHQPKTHDRSHTASNQSTTVSNQLNTSPKLQTALESSQIASSPTSSNLNTVQQQLASDDSISIDNSPPGNPSSLVNKLPQVQPTSSQQHISQPAEADSTETITATNTTKSVQRVSESAQPQTLNPSDLSNISVQNLDSIQSVSDVTVQPTVKSSQSATSPPLIAESASVLQQTPDQSNINLPDNGSEINSTLVQAKPTSDNLDHLQRQPNIVAGGSTHSGSSLAVDSRSELPQPSATEPTLDSGSGALDISDTATSSTTDGPTSETESVTSNVQSVANSIEFIQRTADSTQSPKVSANETVQTDITQPAADNLSETSIAEHPSHSQSATGSAESVQRVAELHQSTPSTSNPNQTKETQQPTVTSNAIAEENLSAGLFQTSPIQRLPDKADNKLSPFESSLAEQASIVQHATTSANAHSGSLPENQSLSESQPLPAAGSESTSITHEHRSDSPISPHSIQHLSDSTALSLPAPEKTPRQKTSPEPLVVSPTSIQPKAAPDVSSVKSDKIQTSADSSSSIHNHGLSDSSSVPKQLSSLSVTNHTLELQQASSVPAESSIAVPNPPNTLQRHTKSPQSADIPSADSPGVPTETTTIVSNDQDTTALPETLSTEIGESVTTTSNVSNTLQRQTDSLQSADIPAAQTESVTHISGDQEAIEQSNVKPHLTRDVPATSASSSQSESLQRQTAAPISKPAPHTSTPSKIQQATDPNGLEIPLSSEAQRSFSTIDSITESDQPASKTLTTQKVTDPSKDTSTTHTQSTSEPQPWSPETEVPPTASSKASIQRVATELRQTDAIQSAEAPPFESQPGQAALENIQRISDVRKTAFSKPNNESTVESSQLGKNKLSDSNRSESKQPQLTSSDSSDIQRVVNSNPRSYKDNPSDVLTSSPDPTQPTDTRRVQPSDSGDEVSVQRSTSPLQRSSNVTSDSIDAAIRLPESDSKTSSDSAATQRLTDDTIDPPSSSVQSPKTRQQEHSSSVTSEPETTNQEVSDSVVQRASHTSIADSNPPLGEPLSNKAQLSQTDAHSLPAAEPITATKAFSVQRSSRQEVSSYPAPQTQNSGDEETHRSQYSGTQETANRYSVSEKSLQPLTASTETHSADIPETSASFRQTQSLQRQTEASVSKPAPQNSTLPEIQQFPDSNGLDIPLSSDVQRSLSSTAPVTESDQPASKTLTTDPSKNASTTPAQSTSEPQPWSSETETPPTAPPTASIQRVAAKSTQTDAIQAAEAQPFKPQPSQTALDNIQRISDVRKTAFSKPNNESTVKSSQLGKNELSDSNLSESKQPQLTLSDSSNIQRIVSRDFRSYKDNPSDVLTSFPGLTQPTDTKTVQSSDSGNDISAQSSASPLQRSSNITSDPIEATIHLPGSKISSDTAATERLSDNVSDTIGSKKLSDSLGQPSKTLQHKQSSSSRESATSDSETTNQEVAGSVVQRSPNTPIVDNNLSLDKPLSNKAPLSDSLTATDSLQPITDAVSVQRASQKSSRQEASSYPAPPPVSEPAPAPSTKSSPYVNSPSTSTQRNSLATKQPQSSGSETSLQRSSKEDIQPELTAAAGRSLSHKPLGSASSNRPRVLQPLGVLKPLPSLRTDKSASIPSVSPQAQLNPAQRQAISNEWAKNISSKETTSYPTPQSVSSEESSDTNPTAANNTHASIQRRSDSDNIPSEWSNLEDLVTHLQSNPSEHVSAKAAPTQPTPNSKTPTAAPPPPEPQTVILPKPATVTVQRQISSQPATKPTVIQACKDTSSDANSANTDEQTDENHNYSQYLELLAQEVYGLLRQRLSLEQERRGPKYPR